MKKLLSILVSFLVVFAACTKTDTDLLLMMKLLKSQNDSMRVQILALQKTSDSIALSLKNLGAAQNSMGAKVDSIRSQLGLVLSQIAILNTKLNDLNANVDSIKIQIEELRKVCDHLTALLLQCCGPQVSINEGLVAYYPFSGNTNDSTPNLNHGILQGAVLTTDRFGTTNSAYQFGNSSIRVPHKSYLGFSSTSQFTVSLWAYKTGNQNIQHLIGKRPASNNLFNWQVAINMNTGEGLSFSGNDRVNAIPFGATSGKNMAGNVWVHIVGMYDRGNWKLYVDGQLSFEINISSFYNDTVVDLLIGNSGNFEPFYGKLDEVRIYSRTLSVEEVSWLAGH